MAKRHDPVAAAFKKETLPQARIARQQSLRQHPTTGTRQAAHPSAAFAALRRRAFAHQETNGRKHRPAQAQAPSNTPANVTLTNASPWAKRRKEVPFGPGVLLYQLCSVARMDCPAY